MAKITKYKKKNGQVAWMFKGHVATDPRTGQKINTTRRGFKTKLEAKQVLDELAYGIKYGTKKKATDMTFEDLYEEWIAHQRTSVKPSTIAISVRFAKNQILPEFGKMKLTDITVPYCQKVLRKWHERYKMWDSIRKQTGQILAYGVSMEYIESNAMRKNIRPRNKEYETERNFYTKEELNTLLNSFKKFGNTKQYAYFRVLAYTGMRKSEVLALHWRIQQKLDYLKLGYNTSSEERYVFTSLKNTLYTPNTVNDWLRYILKNTIYRVLHRMDSDIPMLVCYLKLENQ